MRLILSTVCALIMAGAAAAEPLAADGDPLLEGFRDPPAKARPRVFWQWVNGNASVEGVKLDLAWMKRAGIGGAIQFDIGFATPPVPQYVKRRIGYGSSAWRRAMRVAAREADRLGLNLGVHAGGGWSQTGGPWVTPEQAMKKLVWSETEVSGQGPFQLAAPPSVNGPYQDLEISARFAEPRLYRDVRVLAFRQPDAHPQWTANIGEGEIEASAFTDGRFGTVATSLPVDGVLALASERAGKIFAVTLGVQGAWRAAVIETSPDGRNFIEAARLETEERPVLPVRTIALPGAPIAKVVRLRALESGKAIEITEFAPRAEPTVDRVEDKAGWTAMAFAPQAVIQSSAAVAQPSEVLDLTDQVSADGALHWKPPSGRWRVLRLGWSLTGRRNTPASAESLGLEVDKLNASAVRGHMDAVLKPLKAELGAYYGAGGLGYAITDSWEAGQSNWTDDMIAAFTARRGYDPTPWLPVLTGRVIGDPVQSEQFLWDFRRTIADLLTERHYAEIARRLHEDGLAYEAEAPGVDLPVVADGLQAKGRVDVPMGEFWVYPPGQEPLASNVADIREAASAAHVYGKPLVAAEALTTRGEEPWRTGPWRHKPIVDRFFAEGVNDLVLHTSVHQPFVDRKPGITLRQYGQHLTRNETWAEDARGWTDYLARSAYLLRQGRPGADIAYFYGEDAPASLPWREGGRPSLPAGYDFDYLDAESLLKRLTVKDGRLQLPSGVSYAALVIPPAVTQLSLAVLAKLEALVKDGAVIIGARPSGSPTFSDATASAAWTATADRLWSGLVHKGSVDQILRAQGLRPALEGLADGLVWTRRLLPDGELYFIANPTQTPIRAALSFRISGKAPELWNAETGDVVPAAYDVSEGRVRVVQALAAGEAIFVVFRRPDLGPKPSPKIETVTTVADLSRDWRVAFASGWGPDRPVKMSTLVAWNDHHESEIRYFSGAAVYSRRLDLPVAWLADGARIRLDLGDVRELATITVNGRRLRGLWKPPFTLDITDQLRPGRNRLEVRVVNFWANRLIGDLQPGARPRTFTSIAPFTADSPLSPSGLLGPVRLERVLRRTPAMPSPQSGLGQTSHVSASQ